MRSVSKAVTVMLGINLALMFAVALWFRVSSVEDMPEPHGDEAYFGIQAGRMIRGQTFSLQTGTDNYLDPLTTGMQVPLLLIFPPAFWILRVPALVSGVLVVVLAYVLGSRVLDRATALIASVLLATLPVLIAFSRMGLDFSQTPLVSLIALYFAFRAHRLGLVLSAFLCYVVQPVNVFLLPMLLAVYLVQVLRQTSDDPRLQRTRVLRTLAVAAGVVVAVGAVNLGRTNTQYYYAHFAHSHHRFQYLKMFQRFLFMSYWPIPRPTLGLHAWLFWGSIAVVLPAGLVRLVRTRQWDRVALIGGLLTSLAGFRVVAGANVFCMDTYRYGTFLILPTVLSFACLLQALLIRPTDERRAVVRRVQLALVLLPAWALLACVKLTYFDYWTDDAPQSIWTFRTDQVDPKERALRVILDDVDHAPADPSRSESARHLIIAEDWWLYRPLQYLLLPRPDLKVIWWDRMGESREEHREHLRQVMEEGAYAIGFAGREIDSAVSESFSPDQVQSWTIAERRGQPYVMIHRLQDARESAPSADPLRLTTRPTAAQGPAVR